MSWHSLIKDIPDYPKAGIIFKDITPLLADGPGFHQPDVLACPEARGFIFASALAQRLGIGFIPLRKPGKLPREVSRITFDLEYGQDTLEVHKDDVKSGVRVMMVDDVLATGGTMAACIELLQSLGAQVIGAAFLMEIEGLHGRDKLGNIEVCSLVKC